jgi:hypothetical protein
MPKETYSHPSLSASWDVRAAVGFDDEETVTQDVRRIAAVKPRGVEPEPHVDRQADEPAKLDRSTNFLIGHQRHTSRVWRTI